jgi:hypothetical protein
MFSVASPNSFACSTPKKKNVDNCLASALKSSNKKVRSSMDFL